MRDLVAPCTGLASLPLPDLLRPIHCLCAAMTQLVFPVYARAPPRKQCSNALSVLLRDTSLWDWSDVNIPCCTDALRSRHNLVRSPRSTLCTSSHLCTRRPVGPGRRLQPTLHARPLVYSYVVLHLDAVIASVPRLRLAKGSIGIRIKGPHGR